MPTRQRGVLNDVAELVASLAEEHLPVTVLDCGGGSGRVAVPVAELGAHVTVVDISADALATLTRRAAEAAVGERVIAVQGDIEAIAEAVPAGAFDLALMHEVLGAVDPAAVLASVATVLRPGGLVSVLVVNPVASVLARVLAGDLDAALAELRIWTGPRRVREQLDVVALARLCTDAGLVVEQVRGVGVFSDFVPAAAADGGSQGGALADIAAEMEALCADIAPYRDIAARLNVVARRPRAT